MLAMFSPGGDFKRYYRGTMPRLAVIVIIAMPLLYCALYLWAFWNPFNKVDKMPIAIVNLDTGATVGGAPLNAGEQVVQGIVDSKQLDLHKVSEKDANDGVERGKYYFSITLPADFSKGIASATSSDPNPAQLIFTYNDATNYLATVMGQDAALQVINQVSAQVGGQMFATAFKDVNPMLGKVKEAAAGASELSAGLVTAKNGGAQLSGALDELQGAIIKATDPLLNASANLHGLSADQLAALAGRMSTSADRISAASSALSGASGAYQSLSNAVATMQNSPDPAVRAAAQAVASARDQLGVPSANQVPSQADLQQLSQDSSTLSAQLADPNSPVRLGMSLLEPGVLHDDLVTARSAATQLSQGANDLSSGLVKLSDGANQLSAGLNQGAEAIPHWTQEQQDKLAATLAQPVQLKENTKHEAPTFGTGFAPFFFSLALFVGGIIAWMLFTPILSRPVAQGLGSFRAVMATYAPTFAVGFLQVSLLYTVVVFAVGLDPVHSVGTFGFLLLVIAMFLAMIQMFNAFFGPAVGRVVTLAFLMVQLTSAGGIYPVPTTAKPFQYIHWVDPMTYTVTGLRQLTVGGVDYRLWGSIAVIILLTALFLAVSTWSARRNRQYTMDRLYPPVEV